MTESMLMKNKVKRTYFLSNDIELFHMSKYGIFSTAYLRFEVFVIKFELQISGFGATPPLSEEEGGPGRERGAAGLGQFCRLWLHRCYLLCPAAGLSSHFREKK